MFACLYTYSWMCLYRCICKHACIYCSMSGYIETCKHTWRLMHDG